MVKLFHCFVKKKKKTAELLLTHMEEKILLY